MMRSAVALTMNTVSRAVGEPWGATIARTNIIVRSPTTSPATEMRGATTAIATSAHALIPSALRA